MKAWFAIGTVLILLVSIPLQIVQPVSVGSITLSSPFRDSIRVSFDNATSSNVSAAIDQFGDTHVVWVDYRSGNGDIYYVKLDNEGNKLVNDAKITNDSWASRNPTIAVDNAYHAYVVWQDNRTGNWELYLAKLLYSPKNITFMLNDIRVSDANPADSIQPNIAVEKNGDIDMVWSDARNIVANSNYEIYFKKLRAADATGMTADMRITFDPGISLRPKLAVASNNTVHLVWYDFRDSAGGTVINHGIFYRILSANGTPLIPDTRLTFASPTSTPSIAIDSSNTNHIVFDDDRYASFDIFYTKVAWNGTTLIDDRRISPQDGFYSLKPDINCDGRGFISVVWQDNASGKWVIKFDRLFTDGSILEYDRTISSSSLKNSTAPKVFLDSHNNSLLFWIGEVENNTEVYFTRMDLPDVQLNSSSIQLSNLTPLENTRLFVNVTVKNMGKSIARNVTVGLEVNGTSRASAMISAIEAGSSQKALLQFTTKRGDSVCSILIDSTDQIFESDETNNIASKNFVTRFFEYSVATGFSSLVIPPGNTMNFTANVTNIGNEANNIELNISDSFPSDWIFLVNNTNNTKFIRIIPAAYTISIPFSLIVPDGALAGTQNFSIASKSLNDQRRNVTLDILVQVPWVGQIGIVMPIRSSIFPGETYDYPFRIVNLGNHLEYFKVSFDESNHWETSIIGGIEILSLGPMENANITCQLSIPNYIPPMRVSVLSIQVQSLNLTTNRVAGNVSATVATLERLGIEMVYQNVTQDIFHRTNGVYRAKITNTGNAGEQVNLSIKTNYSSWFSIDDNLFIVLPGASHTVQINLSSPPTALAGEYAFSFVARSQSNPAVLIELPMSFKVMVFYDLFTWTDPYILIGKAGQSFNTMVYVQNFGNSIDEVSMFIDVGKFNKSVTVLGNVTYSIEIEQMPEITLKPNENKSFILSIEIPASESPGNYSILITATSANDPRVTWDTIFIASIPKEISFLDFLLSPLGLLIIGLAVAGIIVVVLIYLGILSNPFARKKVRKLPPQTQQTFRTGTKPGLAQTRGLPPKGVNNVNNLRK